MGRNAVSLDGFNLHASVHVGADDDVARERLARYCARPAFALERLHVLPDGRIAYRVKQPRKNATHRILTPTELLARIAALIPPPRHPFLRYHGVLAPNSRWRNAIVPRPTDDDVSVPPTALPASSSFEPPAPNVEPSAPHAPRGGRSMRSPCRGSSLSHPRQGVQAVVPTITVRPAPPSL